jgi:hypothetical protein
MKFVIQGFESDLELCFLSQTYTKDGWSFKGK